MGWLWRQEKGQALTEFALLMPVLALLLLMGMMALSLDVGYMVTIRARLQQAADAAVLAGARHLPQSPITAVAQAIDYGQRNGVALSSQDIAVSATYASNDTITVAPQQTAALFFAPVLGLSQVPAP